MVNLDAEIRAYYSTPDDSFWHWQDKGESIAWKDQKTIAFADELKVILKHMVPYGLPRLGSILILVAATRKSWAADGSEVGLLAGMLASFSNEDDSNADLLQRTLVGLHKVRALESELRTPLEAKLALIEMVFEDQSPVVTKQNAEPIANAIRPGLVSLIESTPESNSTGYGPLGLVQDLAALVSGLERINPDAIRLRQKTGLNEIPFEAPLENSSEEVSPCDAVRGLIEELHESQEYKGIAQVAKQLLPTTSLPRKLTASREQELGGFSDIANRGTPDRLLLSELALDGMTLAIRVAMNEAMYLHREQPPSAPHFRRELLIDSGVRAWGTPRVFAVAAALALSATVQRGSSLGVWRGSGTSLREVDLTTREGLTNHLAVLESDPNLAEALPEFVRLIEDSDVPIEPILLVPDDAFEDEKFEQAVRQIGLDRLYVATVSRTGLFQLKERSRRGEKLLRRAEIDIDLLFSEQSKLTESVERGRLPAILRANPFPLRLPHNIDQEKSWLIGDWGVLSITGDGRLMHWKQRGKGGEQLSDKIPKGKLWWASPTCSQGITSFVFGPAEKPVYFRVDLTGGEINSTLLLCNKFSGITFHNDALFCCSQQERKVYEVNSHTGEVVGEQVMPSHLDWKRGRFFIDRNNKWYALSHDGNSATIDALPDYKKPQDPVICSWDAVGFEGPISLTQKGKLLAEESEKKRLPKCNMTITDCLVDWISPDGLMIHGTCSIPDPRSMDYGLQFRIRLDSTPVFFVRSTFSLVDGRVDAISSSVPIRKKFKSIGVTVTGQLTLNSVKGQEVSFTSRHGMPLFMPLKDKSNLLHEQNFNLIEMADVRYKFSMANWSDGSQAVLDSRGLLHLKPADPDIPEISLVLAEGELTAWCSDARTFGRKYFLPEVDGNSSRGLPRREICDETIAEFVEGIRATS